MPKVNDDVNTFLASRSAQAIHPVPDPGPNQRGPSCGFYALAYVLEYWHDRLHRDPGNQWIRAVFNSLFRKAASSQT